MYKVVHAIFLDSFYVFFYILRKKCQSEQERFENVNFTKVCILTYIKNWTHLNICVWLFHWKLILKFKLFCRPYIQFSRKNTLRPLLLVFGPLINNFEFYCLLIKHFLSRQQNTKFSIRWRILAMNIGPTKLNVWITIKFGVQDQLLIKKKAKIYNFKVDQFSM